MMKLGKLYLVGSLFMWGLLVSSGCCQRGEDQMTKSLQNSPLILISIGSNRMPQVSCSGERIRYEYQSSFSGFSISVSDFNGKQLIYLRGTMRLRTDEDNRVAIALQSSSTIPYQIRLLGFSTKEALDIPEEETVEDITIQPGEVNTNLFRYIYYTYDLLR